MLNTLSSLAYHEGCEPLASRSDRPWLELAVAGAELVLTASQTIGYLARLGAEALPYTDQLAATGASIIDHVLEQAGKATH